MPRVVCAGHVNWDRTLRVDRLPEPDGEATVRRTREAGGGSAANVAAALSGLGVDAGLIGSVGSDDAGKRCVGELGAAGVDLAGLRRVEGATAVKHLLVDDDGEVAVLGVPGVNEAVGPGDVDPDYVGEAEWVHLTGQHPDTATRVAALAAEAGVRVSVDPGRRPHGRDYGEALRRADILFATEREADGLDRPEGVAVVEKRGRAGARVRLPDGTEHAHPGFDPPCVDTTGAGDALAAGYLAALLGDADAGRPPDHARALAVGNACGALASAQLGARTSISRTDVEAVLDGEAPEPTGE